MALGWAALGVVAGAVTFARSSAGGRAAAGLVVAVCLGIAVAAVVFWPEDAAGDAGQAAADPEPVGRAPAQNATPVQPTGSDSAVLSPASPAAHTDGLSPDPANPQGDPSDPPEPPGGATQSAPPDAETAPGN
jgi:hypothetical protein